MTGQTLPTKAHPRRTHRRRGEGFGSCLLMIILVLGGGIFFWYKFGKNRALIRAGQQLLIMKEYNQDADIAYRRHFREKNAGNAQQSREMMKKLVGETMKGKYTGKAEDFEQKCHEANEKLLEGITELDMNQVPKQFISAHKTLSTSYGQLYQALEELKNAYSTEPAQQKAAMEKAYKVYLEAYNNSVKGENAIRASIDAGYLSK